MSRLGGILMLAGLFLGGAVRPASAQDCGQYYWTPCAPGDHMVPSFGQQQFQPTHGNCQYCFLDPCHILCEGSFETLGSAFGSAYAQILVAARNGDAIGVLRLGPVAASYVEFNPQRNALQIKSCSKDFLIASITLPRMTAVPAWALAQSGRTILVMTGHLLSQSDGAIRGGHE